ELDRPGAIAVDPLYARSGSVLATRARADAGRGHDFMADPVRSARFVWSYFASPAEHLRQRQLAAERFAPDPGRVPGPHLAGGLPGLPFASGRFDLVLSSHLLFTYGERLALEFHVAALVELARVGRTEVRVFPLLLHTTGEPYPALDEIRARLQALGVASQIR